jgi:hypothetical protein
VRPARQHTGVAVSSVEKSQLAGFAGANQILSPFYPQEQKEYSQKPGQCRNGQKLCVPKIGKMNATSGRSGLITTGKRDEVCPRHNWQRNKECGEGIEKDFQQKHCTSSKGGRQQRSDVYHVHARTAES